MKHAIKVYVHPRRPYRGGPLLLASYGDHVKPHTWKHALAPFPKARLVGVGSEEGAMVVHYREN